MPDTDNPLRRIKEEIRADAEAAHARALQSTNNSVAPRAIGEIEPERNQFTIAELAGFPFIEFNEFIERSYAALLRRTPDSTNLAAQIRLLDAGRSKIEVLGNLLFSGEGRAVGVRVPGLYPRYLLAKATRIPVFGYAIEWLMCLAGLPRILRHQRIADSYHAASFHAVRKELAGVTDQIELLRAETSRLDRQRTDIIAQMQQLGERFVPVHAEIEKASHDTRDLRHLVLSMNHWLATLRQNLAALESAETEQARKRNVLHAEVSEKMLQADQQRAGWLEQLAENFTQGLSSTADVLDVGGGLDWLQTLSRRGVNVTAVNQNNVIGQRIREAAIASDIAEPTAVLARIADCSLDAVAILDLASLLRVMPAAVLVDILRRVLRPTGRVLFGIGAESATIADRLEGRANVLIDCDLIERILQVSGFVQIKRITVSGSSDFVLASQPQ